MTNQDEMIAGLKRELGAAAVENGRVKALAMRLRAALTGSESERAAMLAESAWLVSERQDASPEQVAPVVAKGDPDPVAMLSGALNHARDALRFYADREHFTMHQPDEWDTVSGEPENFYEDSHHTATVEDGSVAKRVLDDIAGVERFASAYQAPTPTPSAEPAMSGLTDDERTALLVKVEDYMSVVDKAGTQAGSAPEAAEKAIYQHVEALIEARIAAAGREGRQYQRKVDEKLIAHARQEGAAQALELIERMYKHHRTTSLPLAIENYGSALAAENEGRKLWHEDVPAALRALRSTDQTDGGGAS